MTRKLGISNFNLMRSNVMVDKGQQSKLQLPVEHVHFDACFPCPHLHCLISSQVQIAPNEVCCSVAWQGWTLPFSWNETEMIHQRE